MRGSLLRKRLPSGFSMIFPGNKVDRGAANEIRHKKVRWPLIDLLGRGNLLEDPFIHDSHFVDIVRASF